MNLRQFGLGALLAAALSLPGAASAITIDGITIAPGSTLTTMTLFEGESTTGGPITTAGQELVGIGLINQIIDANNNIVWSNGQNGRELTLHFYNYIAEDFIPGGVAPSFDSITFSGGNIDLYSQTAGSFSFAGSITDGITSATSGNLWLAMEGSPIGGFGGFSGNPLTLSSDAVRTATDTPFTSASNVTGTGFLDVVGGPAAVYFDTNTFGCAPVAGAPCPDDADLTFTSSGQIPVQPTSAWAFRGTGEVQAFVQVPEPGTMALLGLGLAGLGFAARRRVKAA